MYVTIPSWVLFCIDTCPALTDTHRHINYFYQSINDSWTCQNVFLVIDKGHKDTPQHITHRDAFLPISLRGGGGENGM